jgi:hypothetical protein
MAALGKLVAARYLDGRVVKGRTVDFKPLCDTFHLSRKSGRTITIDTRDLKALFFIKTADGDPEHEEDKDFDAKEGPEREIWVEFLDGEHLAGFSSALGSPKGFFFTPTDRDSNLERVFAFRPAVRRLLQGPQALRAAEAYNATRLHRSDPPPRY